MHRGVALRRQRAPTPPSTRCGSTICGRTSTARATAAAPGREITRGLPDGATINVVREDPLRRGLLFAGSERAVYVSFDDGENWQSLRLNMPATSIRDLVIKDDDLVVGTHGRGFWILDDITPLRQITADVARAPAYLFRPATAWRFRWNKNTDTPLPPDEPAAPQSARRRRHQLPARRTTHGPGDPRDHRDGDRRDRPALFERRSRRTARRRRNIPDYWIRPAADALDHARPASLRLGRALRAAAG